PQPVRKGRKRSKRSPDKAREYRSRAYKKNYDKILARNRAYRRKQPEKVKGFETRYHEAHPEVKSAASANRRARLVGAPGSHTPADIKAIWERQGHRCAVPNCPYPIALLGKDKYHIDHIMPIKLGGSNDAANLQILCKLHN